MKFSDLPVGRKCITAPDGEGVETRYILVVIPKALDGSNVIRFCDGQLSRLAPETEVIEVE